MRHMVLWSKEAWTHHTPTLALPQATFCRFKHWL